MDSDEVRISAQTLKVLGVLMTHPKAELSGADIARTTKLASGTLYPILFRLENAGWVQSQWEMEEPQKLGRPRRRLYRITGTGTRKARAAVRDIRHAFGGLAWES